MIDINSLPVEIPCPKCNYLNEVQLIDIKLEKLIFCNNCKCSIQLKDKEASVHTGVDKINDAIYKLENLIKNFGK